MISLPGNKIIVYFLHTIPLVDWSIGLCSVTESAPIMMSLSFYLIYKAVGASCEGMDIDSFQQIVQEVPLVGGTA